MQTDPKAGEEQSPKVHHHHHHHHHMRGEELGSKDILRRFHKPIQYNAESSETIKQLPKEKPEKPSKDILRRFHKPIQYNAESNKNIKQLPKEKPEKPSKDIINPASKYTYAPLEFNTIRAAQKKSEDPKQESEIPLSPEPKKHHKHHHHHEDTELLLLISPEKNGKSNSVETLYFNNRKVTFSSVTEANDYIYSPTPSTRKSEGQSHSEVDIRSKFRHFSQTPSKTAEEVAKLLRDRSKHESNADAESQKKEKSVERPEYASNPREFTKSGCPIPFWQLEMKKGPEYLVRLHRHYGKRCKHERVPVYKPDLDVVSINTVDSNTSFENFEDIYHDALKRLIPLDRIFLFHRVEITKGIFLSETFNDYHILNHHGHILYRVREDITFKCHKKIYTFFDYWGTKFMQLTKIGRKYQICCPLGTVVGFVVPHYRIPFQLTKTSIHDENHTELIQFEKLPQKLFCDKSQDCIFEYQSVRGQGPLGMITMKLANLKMSNFSENDYYGIKIHNELSPNIKATVMAAWFIIYKLHYEGKTYREIHHNLTKAAKHLFADLKPSTEELPNKLIGDIVLIRRDDDQQ